MNQLWTKLRRAPMWSVALGVALAVVVLNLTVSDDPSIGVMTAVIAILLAVLFLLVALGGTDGFVVLGLVTVSVWAIRALDFPDALEIAAFVVLVPIVAHLMCESRPDTRQRATRAARHR